MAEGSEIKGFYRGKNIFITGSTGFLGIALLEKLLRSCDVGNIYLLLRPKRGKEISERLEEIKKNLVFERLKKEKGDAPFGKLVAIAGDIGEEGLGLSMRDRQTLIENVNIVFHSAATLDFEAGFRPTVMINLLGTRRIVELCSEIQDLNVLIHVSSAYVNSNRNSAEEILYEIPQKADDAIDLVNRLSDDKLEEATPRFLGNHPNSYTITKAMAEFEVKRGAEKFPCAIVRPSMIIGAWEEPCPGWTISKNGPQGFIMGAGKGVVRRLPVKKELIYDYIPVDIVVKTLIVAGWNAALMGEKKPLIYHSTSSTCRPFNWQSLDNRVESTLHAFPLKSAVWYPAMKLLPSLTLFKISAIIFHFIPAFFFDNLMRLTGGRAILIKLHTRVNKSLDCLAPFIFREWFFDNSNTLALDKKISDTDRQEFSLDISTLDWVAVFTNLVKGVRRYLHNEEPKTLPAAKRKLKIFYVLNVAVQVFVFGLYWYLASAVSGKNFMSVAWVVPFTYALFCLL